MCSKRKFPGPAGGDSNRETEDHVKKGYGLDDEPWKQVSKLVGSPSISSDKGDPPVERYNNISWIRKHAGTTLKGRKVPFLIGVLPSPPKTKLLKAEKNKSLCVKLLDESGTIEVALDPDVVSALEEIVHDGSCLAFQNIGLLNMKGHLMLMCSMKNLIAVYSSKSRISKSLNKKRKYDIDNENEVVVFKIADIVSDFIRGKFSRCYPSALVV